MSKNAQVIGTKTLASATTLHASSPSSSHPLIALASPSTSTESKVSLYRTGGGSDQVWEWTNVGEPVKSTGLGLKGKAKAAPVGKVEQLAWSPKGNYLAVAISAATPSSSSTLAILSLHNGQLLHPPTTPLPTSASISHLSWQELDYPIDSDLSSWSIDLIRKLPGLPKLSKDSSGSGGSGPGGSGAAGGVALGNFSANVGGGGGGGGGGVFGAKQAMLERERAKEAQRVLSIRDASAGAFPTLLSDMRPDEIGNTGDEKVKSMLRSSGEVHDETEKTVLCVGDEEGKLHLYLGGSVFLGTIPIGESTSIIGLQVLPSSSSKAQFAIHSASSSTLSISRLSLPIPPSLQLVIRQSSALRSTIQHAFEALQEVRNLWDEARRIGKGWLQRIADVSRPQGVVLPPVTQIHLLLMTGRPTRSLHDFLASKMNERGLVKWEQEMGLALEKMRRVGWMSVEPAMERAIILLLEIDAWSRWPEKFTMYGFNRKTILTAIEVAKEAIKSTFRLQSVVEEEEKCFRAFSIWLHYELDKLAQQDGSEVRPVAKFHPIPVSSYIENSLSPQTSPITSFLSMGLASLPLPQNSAISSGLKWVHSLKTNLEEEDEGTQESLEATLKRLGEELKGQKEREGLEAERDAMIRDDMLDLDEFAIDAATHPPFAQQPTNVDEARPTVTPSEIPEVPPPTSISVLLHLVANLSGKVMENAVRNVGALQELQGSTERGPLDARDEQDRKVRRVRSTVSQDGRLCEAWITGSCLHLARQVEENIEQVQRASYRLSSSDGFALNVLGFELFNGDREIVIALESTAGNGPKHSIVSLDLASVPFSTDPLPDKSPLLPLDNSIALDSHFPPSHVSLTTQNGRRIAFTLAGEGRRLETLDLGADNDALTASRTAEEGDIEMQ